LLTFGANRPLPNQFRQRLKQASRVGVCKWELTFVLSLIFAQHQSRVTSVAPKIARILIRAVGRYSFKFSLREARVDKQLSASNPNINGLAVHP